MKLLHQIVIPKVAADWEMIAEYLDYDRGFIKIIKRDNIPNGHLECCRALFRDWLSTDRGVSPKTWSTLIRVLRQIQPLEVATTKKIVKELSEAGVFV